MNIFKCLSSEDYKHMLDAIRHCILATDLALFFGNKARLREIVDKDQYDWQKPEHRCDMVLSIMPNYSRTVARLGQGQSLLPQIFGLPPDGPRRF